MSDLGIGDILGNAAGTPDPGARNEPKVLDPKEIRRRFEKSQRSTQLQREQAAINEQFILNRHWLRWNRGVGRLEELPRNPDRVRVTVNRIGPDSHRLLAKLTSRDLIWEVKPNSPDDQAIQASRVAEHALAWTAEQQGWEDIRYDHALSTWQAGVAGIMVEWDRSVGVPVAVDESGQTIHTGDVKLTCVPLHEIAVEPGTRNAEKALWWIHARALPAAEVQDMYGLDYEPKADARAVDSVWRVHQPTDQYHTPLTMVFTLYERPSANSEGRVVTIVGDEYVDQSPWYFPFTDRLNLATCVVQPVSNKWYGHTPMSDAVPVQTAMNASWSSILEHLKLAGNARLWIPEGSVEDISDLSDTAGEHAEYIPINGARPQYEAPPSMPEWWVRAPDLLAGAMDTIVGQSDVSRGIAPSGVESGIAMSLLQENSDTPIGRFAKNMAGMWGRVGSMVLELFATFVQDSREAQIVMPNNRIPEVVQWNGLILHGHTTATVPMDAVTPRNRNAQAAYAFQLHDRGLVQSPIELAKIADLPDQDDLLEGIDPDSARAMRENSHLAAGAARTVDTIDDHFNHLIHHRNFMRSQRFENLPPQIQENFRLHMAAHEMYAAAIAAENAQAASVSPLAAALPTETVNPLDPQSVAEATMVSQMAPSAATAGLGQQVPTDLAASQLNNGPQQQIAPTGTSSPDAPMTPTAEATQDLLSEQPPQ